MCRGEALAEADGLVTAATSLVLVDEVGEKQLGVPVMRKVALPLPAIAVESASFAPSYRMAESAPFMANVLCDSYDLEDRWWRSAFGTHCTLADMIADLATWDIDWDHAPAALAEGKLDNVSTKLADKLRRLTWDRRVKELYGRMGLDAVQLAIGLLAHAQAALSRTEVH